LGFSIDWLRDFYGLMMGYFWMLNSLSCVPVLAGYVSAVALGIELGVVDLSFGYY
jgi:hypothetical protein